MSGADAFAAVIDYCDVAAHAMPILGSYVGFERYVAYGGIAGWCRKAGRDAWAHQTKGVQDDGGTALPQMWPPRTGRLADGLGHRRLERHCVRMRRRS